MSGAAPLRAEGDRVESTATMREYIAWLATGIIGVVLAYVLGLVALDKFGRLPPPQFSNSLCVDEKLNVMHVAPPRDVNLLVVGSSVAWRHFNSAVAEAVDPSLRIYNAGFCGTSLRQTEDVAKWLVGRLPTVRHLIIMASPIDFTDCSTTRASTFEIAGADEYVFLGGSSWRAYFRYFDPVTLIGNSRNVAARRNDVGNFDALRFDRFGDGPIEPPRDRGLHYGPAGTFDARCFAALRSTATMLGRRGITVDIFETPIHPAWRAKFDPDGMKLGLLRSDIGRALAGTGGRQHELDGEVPPDGFYDAIHVRWSVTPALTRALLKRLDYVHPESRP